MWRAPAVTSGEGERAAHLFSASPLVASLLTFLSIQESKAPPAGALWVTEGCGKLGSSELYS